MSIFSTNSTDSPRRSHDALGAPSDVTAAGPTPIPVLSGVTSASAPLYIAAALVQISGLAAVAYQVMEPNFTVFTIGMTVIGTCTSYLLRRAGVRPNYLKMGALVLTAVFLFVLRRSELFELLVPSQTMLTQEVVLLCALALTATFGSFLLITDDALIFTCVWSIAMIGLTGTVNINAELPLCFIVFLLSTSFLLVHQNSLHLGREGSGGGRRPHLQTTGSAHAGAAPAASFPAPAFGPLRLLRAQLFIAFAAWGASLVLGSLIAIPVQMVGRNLSLAAILQQIRSPLTLNGHGSAAHLSFDQLKQFTVGLGPVDDDPTVQLTVLSDSRQYWRGRTYDRYTGHGWINSEGVQEIRSLRPDTKDPDANGLYAFTLPQTNEPPIPSAHKRRFLADFHCLDRSSNPFFAAAEPVLVRVPSLSLVMHMDRTIGSGRSDGSDYQVISDVTTEKPSALRSSGVNYPRNIADRYITMGLQDDSIQALAQLAISGAADDPYDRANAIKHFISQRCSYSINARAVPRDRDAVEFFLNDSHEGYCDLYASAMVELCRYAGIPARVATGYAPGTVTADNPDLGPARAKGDTRQRFVLRGNDLHAWAEVYFVGYGWIVFDATEDTNTLSAGTPIASGSTPHAAGPDWRKTVAEICAILALLAGIVALTNEARLRLRDRALNAQGALGQVALFANPRDKHGRNVEQAYRAALRALRRKGVKRGSAVSAREFVALIHTQFDSDTAAPLARLTELEEEALFAGADSSLAAPEAAEAQQLLGQLRQQLRGKRPSDGDKKK